MYIEMNAKEMSNIMNMQPQLDMDLENKYLLLTRDHYQHRQQYAVPCKRLVYLGPRIQLTGTRYPLSSSQLGDQST